MKKWLSFLLYAICMAICLATGAIASDSVPCAVTDGNIYSYVDAKPNATIATGTNDTQAELLAASGTCGDNLTWTLDGNGVLTISGSGSMASYTSESQTPWYYHSSIKTLVIENGVTSIGAYAFSNRSWLTDVTIPNSVTSIGNWAFYGCYRLTGVTIPNSVTSVGDYAFTYCSGLTSITIPDSVTSIGTGAFASCSELVSINVASENTQYSAENGILFNKTKTALLFYPAKKLEKTYLIPHSVTSIGGYAFDSCSELTSIIIPNSVISIGYSAFGDCSGLTDVTIPDSVTYIGNFAFTCCSGLTNVTISNSVTYIGEWAFDGCIRMADVYYGGTEAQWKTLKGNIDIGNSLLLNATIHYNNGGQPVTYTVNFDGNGGRPTSTILNVQLSDKVIRPVDPTRDGYEFVGWFTDVQATTAFDFINTTIQANITLYAGWKAVTSPDIIAQGTCGGEGNGTNLSWILTSNGVLTISGSGSMANYSDMDAPITPWYPYRDNFTTLVMKSGITSIGECAFTDCSGMTSVAIPNSVVSIGKNAFCGCSGLTSVTIPKITYIKDETFRFCTNLTDVVLSEGITAIGHLAFEECAHLKRIHIPESVTNVGSAAFSGCISLSDVYFGGNKAQWDKIVNQQMDAPMPGNYNDSFLEATIHYNSNEITLTFEQSVYTSRIGESVTLSATFLSRSTPTDIRWSCSDPNGVTLTGETSVLGPFPDKETTRYISRPMIGNQVGTYEITLSASGVTATTTLTVKEDNEVFISQDTYSLSADEVGLLVATTKYSEGIQWRISGDAIKKYENFDWVAVADPVDSQGNPIPETNEHFKFIGVHKGQATITAFLSTGESASCLVTVEDVNPYYLSLSSFSGITFQEGEKQTIEARLCSRDTQRAVDDNELKSVTSIVWESSDGNVVAFDTEGHTHYEFDHISHGLLGNNADKPKLYGRAGGKADITCIIKVNGYTVSGNTTVSICSKDANELAKRVNNWKDAYNSYVKALEKYLEKESNKGNALSIEEQGNLLMQSDLNKSPVDRLIGFINTADEADDVMLKYVYQAMAQFLTDKAPNEFEKISVKDVDKIAGAITNAVLNFVDTRSYSYTYSYKGKPIHIEISGISAGAASFRKVLYNGKEVAHIISSQNEVLSVLADYVGNLVELDREIVKQAYKEALKELFTKDISGVLEERVKAKVTKHLGEYASRFAETGINDIVKDIQYCFDYYEHLKKVFSASPSNPQSILAVMETLNFNSNPDNIKDYAVKMAMKAIKKAGTSLEALLKKTVNENGGDYAQILTEVYDILFHFHCPVTIAVYSGDVQVGLLSEDDIWYDSDYVYIEQYGDEKSVYTHFGTPLRFEVVGTDEGTLDYIVEEFQDGESARRMNYYDINLYEGKTVSISAFGSTITDNDAIRSESEGQLILCDETLALGDYEIASVLISGLASPHKGGQIQGCGSYVRGDRVALRAIPESNFLFSGWWNEDDELVSLDRVYEFTARDNVSLTAMFSENEQERADSDTVLITDVNVDKTVGVKVQAIIQCPEDIQATACCVFYKINGQMIGVEIQELTSENNRLSFTVGSESASEARFIVLDSDLKPLCSSEKVNIA